MFYEENALEHTPEWKGPLKERSYTDWPCLAIFVVFMACWSGIGFYALAYGDIERLSSPGDSHGRTCGHDIEVVNEPYLVYFDITKCLNDKKICETPGVCRHECPSNNWTWTLWDQQSLDYIRKHIICESGIDVYTKSKEELHDLVLANKCAKWYLNSIPVWGRCIPRNVPVELANITISESDLKEVNKLVEELAWSEKMLHTMISTRGTVLGLIAGGAAICQLYIVLLKWFALPCVFLSVIILCPFFSFLTYCFHKRYVDESNTAWLTLTIVCGIIAVLNPLIVLCLLKRIRLGCQLIKEVGKGVTSIRTSLFFPLLPWLLHLGVTVHAIVVGLHLCTVQTEGTLQTHLMFTTHIIGFIWLYCFITTLGDMILAAIFATWYWMFSKYDIPCFTVAASAWRTLRYNLGTIAFGSLLITVCHWIKYLLAHGLQTKSSRRILTKCLTICGVCLLEKFQHFLALLNRNACIFCAVHGTGLFNSASDAMRLILRNEHRVTGLNKIVPRLLRLCKLSIIASMGIIACWFYTSTTYQTEYWQLPVFFVVVGSSLVANDFFNVYEVAVDTIFLCFIEDCESNDGSQHKPYFTSHQLRKLLHKDTEIPFERF